MAAPTKAMSGRERAPDARIGASKRQGSHHEAQKFKTTGRPSSSAVATELPSEARIVIEGASLPTRLGAGAGVGCDRPNASTTTSAATTTAAGTQAARRRPRLIEFADYRCRPVLPCGVTD